MRALGLVNQLWFIVPVNAWANRVSPKFVNHEPHFSCSSNIPRGLSAYKPVKLPYLLNYLEVTTSLKLFPG